MREGCKYFDKTDYEKLYMETQLATMFGETPVLPEKCFYFCKYYRECYCKDLFEPKEKESK